jgi:ligand-binding SRPBCC domain-containing protein
MKERKFHSELTLTRPVEEVFGFFSDPANLQVLTPDWLNFRIITPQPIKLQAGALIDYRLRIHGFPVQWQTEITVWEPIQHFVDVQKRGPYRLWVHEHRFLAQDNGTRVVDDVRYAPPGGWLIDRLFVRRDIERIFQFRRQKLIERFGRM